MDMSRGPPASAGPKLSFKVTFCVHRRQSSREERREGDRRSSIDLDLSTMKRVSISGRSDDDKLEEEDNMKDADRTEGDEDRARARGRVLTWTQIG